jgi:mannose-6-phosphate isomerase-like protein (cupin superfamily)
VSPGYEIKSRIALRLRERREALQLSLEDLARRPGAGEQPRWLDPATGLLRVAVSPPGTGSSVEIARLELPPGAPVANESQRHLGEAQHLLVLGGALRLTVGERIFAPAAGDCLFMPQTKGCASPLRGDAPAVIS